MKVGTAWVDITPAERLTLQGQMRIRYGEFAHDPLTVNAVVFDSGTTRIALLSCDLIGLPDDFVRDAKARCESELGMPANQIIIACTHTHLAPNTEDHWIGEVNERFMQSVQDAIVTSIARAVEDLEECSIYAGTGYVEEMGFNRRGLHKDGTCDMYYGSWNEDFAGIEGPRDGEVPVIFAMKADGELKAVVPSFSTHPNAVEGESFYSADLVGAVRSHIRRVYGQSVGVAYLTGAAGNTAPTNLEKSREEVADWRGERGLLRSGRYLGSEIAKVIESTLRPMNSPMLRHASAVLSIPIREYPKDFVYSRHWDNDYFRLSRDEWPKLLAEHNPAGVKINVVRVGDAAICTNPAELYVEFGLAIKRQSPARVTLISELTDGSCGYIATREAYLRGGYSTWPALSCKLDEGAGDVIVQATVDLLGEVFAE